MIRLAACCFSLAIASGAESVVAVGAETASSTRAGVYSEAQAVQGGEVYAQSCAMCHGADLAGSFEVPSLRGYFLAHWSGARLDQLFDYIDSAMPLFAPGSLGPDANAELVAFLLKSNGLPAGARPLPAAADALHAITFLGPAKPY